MAKWCQEPPPPPPRKKAPREGSGVGSGLG